MEQKSKSGLGREWDYLEALRAEKVQVSVYLENGIRLTGKIIEHADKVIFLTSENAPQLIYKHAISTILPQ